MPRYGMAIARPSGLGLNIGNTSRPEVLVGK
jgi:hypothetical protein